MIPDLAPLPPMPPHFDAPPQKMGGHGGHKPAPHAPHFFGGGMGGIKAAPPCPPLFWGGHGLWGSRRKFQKSVMPPPKKWGAWGAGLMPPMPPPKKWGAWGAVGRPPHFLGGGVGGIPYRRDSRRSGMMGLNIRLDLIMSSQVLADQLFDDMSSQCIHPIIINKCPHFDAPH